MTEQPRESASFYDREGVRDAYLAHRHALVTSPNMVMEEPAFLACVGDLTNATVLDLGCGDGTFAKQAIERGAVRYLGVDRSTEMIALARQRNDHGPHTGVAEIDFVNADLATPDRWETNGSDFDLVSARMVLHYLDDLDSVMSAMARLVSPSGALVFTVVHPVVTSTIESPVEGTGQRQTQLVDDYFESGSRLRPWFGGEVRWVHRTIEHYVSAVHRAGLRLRDLRECEPVESRFAGNHAEYERRRRVPLMLLIAAEHGPT